MSYLWYGRRYTVVPMEVLVRGLSDADKLRELLTSLDKPDRTV
jgi:hypothetical protein